jgi:hypothetical protein
MPGLKIGDLAERAGTKRRRSGTTKRSGCCHDPTGKRAISGAMATRTYDG